ncbi:MAG: hypothetical protein KF756_09145 [Acidobacteria bacterium]|nr:hypothetical protein [Acidobacteriota bacterium]
MRKFFWLVSILVVIGVSGTVRAQSVAATPGAKPAYKTFIAAMAGGKKALAASDTKAALNAFEAAVGLSRSDVDKADALIAVARIQKDDYHIGSTGGKFKATSFTLFHHPNAVRSLNTALELTEIDDGKRAEIKILRADVYLDAIKHTDAKNTLSKDLEKQFGKDLRQVIRDEMTALATAASTPPDLKVQALILKAKTYKNYLDKYSTAEDVRASFQALKDASSLAGARDNSKAEAFLAIADIARVVNDSKLFVQAYESVTNLPNADASQKYAAATELANVLLENNYVEPARKQLTDSLKVPGLSVVELGGIHRLLAVSYVKEITSKHPAPAAEDKLMASARSELDVAATQTKFKGDDLAEAYRGNAEFITRYKDAQYFVLAHEQLKVALAVPKLTPKQRSKVQYQIGETFRLANKLSEAKAAYLLVTNANPQYFNYAKSRINEIDTPSGPKN